MNAGTKVLLAGIAGLALACGTVWGDQVEQRVAESVAAEQVDAFFPGEGWTLADTVAVQDGAGGVAAWAFVFALSDSGYAAEGAVRAALAAGESGDDGESDLYVSTATIVTGGNDTDSMFFRNFRGLADWYVQLAANEASGGTGAAVRLGPGDIRYAAAAPAGARGPGKLAALKKAAAARKAAAAAERASLPDDLKRLAEEADAESDAAARARWGAAAARAGITED